MCAVQPCVNACVCPGVCARSAASLKLDRRAAALALFTCGGKKLQAVPRQELSYICVTAKEMGAHVLQEVKHC